MVALIAPLLLSGCWERRELNELAFVLGMGIDKADAGYRVTMQVVIPSSLSAPNVGGTGGGVPILVKSLTVPTVYEAEKQFSLMNSRTAYFGHIRVLVIGEELARAGIGEVLDVLKRSREPRNDFYAIVAKGTTAEEVLQILTPLDKLPANKLFNSLDQSYKVTSRTVAIPLNRFIEVLISRGINPVLTGVEITGNVGEGNKKNNVEESVPNTGMQFQNVAVFKGDKMIGWLNGDETIGFNYINNNVDSNSGPVIGDDGQPIVIEALQTTTKRKVKIIDGEPHIYIHVKAVCNVEDVQSSDNLEDERVIRQLEKKSEERIIMRMKSTVKHINNKFNVDILGFGQSIYHASPGTWERLQRTQKETYLQSLPVHFTASVTINRIGVIDKSFVKDIEE